MSLRIVMILAATELILFGEKRLPFFPYAPLPLKNREPKKGNSNDKVLNTPYVLSLLASVEDTGKQSQILPYSWVQFSCSIMFWLFATPWTAAHQASLSITNSQSPPKPTFIESVMPSNHLILSRPLLLLPSIFPSIRVFSNELVLLIRWPKYWSFSFSISPSNEFSGLISFRMYWLDLLAVQGTLKSLIQYHSSKESILQRSAFFIVQLSHPYMTTGKAITLTRWTFTGKVMSCFLICCLGWS